ncbi:hypothetical protein [Candidatus Lokiarchaeum ossiferum]|uniref:hypothetical protein n=1 Tax=Candidatus Lokiarchaeum ossiferum TaxID=2951803 RepID=UPI00352C3972
MGKKKNVKVSDSLEDLFGVESSEGNANTDSKNQLTSIKERLQPKKTHAVTKKSKSHRMLNIPQLTGTEMIECPHEIDSVFITQKAFDDIIMMARAINEISRERWGSDSQKLEVFCYVLTNESDFKNDFPARISEIYIPHHSASETAVNVSTEAVIEVGEYIKENKKILLGWAHSHGHFEVYSSKTDEQNHKALLNDTSNYITLGHFKIKYSYGITVIEDGTHLGVILSQYPCGHIGRVEDTSFDIQGPRYSSKEKENRYLQIKEQLEDRVNLIRPSIQPSREDSLKNISEEFVSEYIRNLRKAKNLLYDKLPDDMDKHFELFQRVLQEYDTLLMSTAEESFTNVSEKLLSAMKQYNNSI